MTVWHRRTAIIPAAGLSVVLFATMAGGTPLSHDLKAAIGMPHGGMTGAAASDERSPFGSVFTRRVEAEPGHISAAALDLGTGRAFTIDPRLHAYTASIVKVPILLAALRRAGPSGLSAARKATARAMIEASDNDAATRLWRYAGGAAAIHRLFGALHMTHTRRAPELEEPWDGVTTTARDQLALLAALTDRVPGVSAAGRRFVLRLMHHIGPGQDWGVTAGTGPARRGWTVALKNGWVPVGHAGWTVNTIGLVSHGHRRYALAVLATGAPSEAAGIKRDQRIARRVARRLGR